MKYPVLTVLVNHVQKLKWLAKMMYTMADCCHLNRSAQRFNIIHLVKNERHLGSMDEMDIIFVTESLLDIFLLKMLTMSSPFENFINPLAYTDACQAF